MDTRDSNSGSGRVARPATEEIIAGRYVQRRLLGQGGMGRVYLVEDTVLDGELLALKLLHPDISSKGKNSQRFLREILLTRKFAHPNIVRTFDAGIANDCLFFTMEHVDGKTLKSVLREKGRITPWDMVDILCQLFEGLGVVHAEQVVHRDIKPGNVILREDGIIKITDFGVARADTSDLTGHDEVVGSTAYMAPEVWSGREITPPADIYSAGVMAYELLTGQLPFRGSSPAEMMCKHLEQIPVPPREICNEIPEWLSLLVLSLLEKDYVQRPCEAFEIRDYLLSAREGLTPSVDGPDGFQSGLYEAPQLSSGEVGYVSDFQDLYDDEMSGTLGIGAELPQSSQLVPTGDTPLIFEQPVSQVIHLEEERPPHPFQEAVVRAAISYVCVIGFALIMLFPVLSLVNSFALNGGIASSIRGSLVTLIICILYSCVLGAVPAAGISVSKFDTSRLASATFRSALLLFGVFVLFGLFHAGLLVFELREADYGMQFGKFFTIVESATVNMLQVATLQPMGTEFGAVDLSIGKAIKVARTGEVTFLGSLLYLVWVCSYAFIFVERILHDALGLEPGLERRRTYRWGCLAVALVFVEAVLVLVLPKATGGAGINLFVPQIGLVGVPVTSFAFGCLLVNWIFVVSFVFWKIYQSSSFRRERYALATSAYESQTVQQRTHRSSMSGPQAGQVSDSLPPPSEPHS